MPRVALAISLLLLVTSGTDAAPGKRICNPGAPCDDANPCTSSDTCDSTGRSCRGTPYSCDDADACTAEACDGAGGCTRTSHVCDDANPCTTDTCNGAGGCTHTSLASTCDDGNYCTADFCDPVAGCWSVPNSLACNDGNACTDPDFCQEGVCTGAKLRENCTNAVDDDCNGLVDLADPGCSAGCGCDDGNWCTTDFCDASGCRHEPNSNACEDGDACTSGDRCNGGACVGGMAYSCDDGSTCTVDWCLGDGTCAHEGVEYCYNGVDDDCDGFVDSADIKCSIPMCVWEPCPPGYTYCSYEAYCF